MNRKTFSQCIYFSVVSLLAFPGLCLATETISVNGSGSALDMMKPMIASFQKTNKDVLIAMDKPLGSSGAVKALLAGALDMVLSSKPLKPEEIAKGARLQLYGKTPLVFITEKNVRKTDITTKELEGIYNGKITTWPNGDPVRLVLRPIEDVDTKIISTLSPGMDSAMKTVRSRLGMIIAVTDPEAYTAVAKTAGGLGATGMTSIIAEKLPVSALTLNGISASPKNLASGAYGLSKEISIVTTPRTSPAAHRLIKFLLSPQGRAIAAKTGVYVTAGAPADK
jgi:phosphate transport system substrate-binding protein